MGIGMVWGVLRTAATRIPWTKVVQSAPLVAEALDRVRTRVKLNEAAQKSLDEQLKQLLEENARLAGELQLMSGRIQRLTARVSLLNKISLLSLLCAVSALILWLVK